MVHSVVEETGEHPRPKKTEENITSTGHRFPGYHSFSSIPDEALIFGGTFAKGHIVLDVVSLGSECEKAK